MKEKIIDQLKEMSQDEPVYITLNVNNITEFRPQIGSLFNKKVSFEVVVISDFATLETELTVLKVLDLLEKKELVDYVSSDFAVLDIASTGPGDRKCINIKWETHLTESELIEMKNIDLDADSSPEQIESTKVSFDRNSVTNMSIECENGYRETIGYTP